MKTKRFTFLYRILLTGIFVFASNFILQAQVVHFENFDSESNGGTSCTSSQTLSSSMWSNASGDDKDWVIDNSTTGSSLTGPQTDHTTGTSTGKYLYTEASSCYSKTAHLVSSTLDLSGYAGFYIDFYYHMYGSSMGTMSVEVSTDNGSTWSTSLWSKTGQQHTSYTDPWSLASVNLSAYTGTGMTTIKIRITGITGSNFYSDMAIDDITLWAPVANDASITSISSPTGSFSPGAQDVKVTLANIGTATLTSASIKYTVNGGTAASYSWTGSIASGSFVSNVNLGSHTFTAGQASIKAWVESPNFNTDGDNSNDTAYSTVYVCNPLSGTYTIGGTSPDFADFTSAVNQIQNCGVSGPVVFNVASGTYTEQVTIGAIPGASATNTITFQSATGDSTAVILQFGATLSAANWTLRLDGADYITFKKMTIAATGASYGRVVEFINSADNNTIANNIIQMPVTTSSNFAGIYSYTTSDQNNIIENNKIVNGYYGIYLYGVSTSNLEIGNQIIENNIDGFSNYGIYLYYQDAIVIRSNTITNGSNATSPYGIRGYYLDNSFIIEKNNIVLNGTSTLYGMYLGNCDGTTSNRGLIANNMVSAGGTGTNAKHGIYFQTGYYTDFFNNSINTHGGTSTSGYAFRLYGNSGNVSKNNTITNNSGGYAYYLNSAYPITSDYNNLYTTGTNLVYYGSAKADLAAWQSTAGQDANSISVNPTFTSNTDLHTGDFLLNAKGTPLTEVTDDIDGEMRTATPDIGADEFTPVGKDAAINWIAPIMPSAAGSKTVKVEIVNAMTVTITDVNLTYTDGTTPVTQAFTGLNIAQGGSDTLSFTTPFAFSGPSTLRAYINSVNSSADLVQTNDTTAWLNISPALSGIYTINGSQATGGTNFANFADAITALNNGGADGFVTFNVASGTYTEQITIGSIIGASASSPVTFQSATGNMDDVKLTYAATTLADPHTIKLNGASYINFKNMTIEGTGTTYARVVFITNNSNNCSFDGNKINTANSSSSNKTPIYITGGNHYLNIMNNTILGGYYGIYCNGSGGSSRDLGNTLEGNDVSDFYYYGIYSYYQQAGEIINNIIYGGTNTIQYGIRAGYCYDGSIISSNKINLNPSNYAYGMYIYGNNYYSYASGSEAPNIIANNMVSVTSGTGTNYDIYAYYGDKEEYYYNSVNISGGGTSSRAFYHYTTTSNLIGSTLKNNNFVATNGGYAVYFNTPTRIVESDYNNYFTSGANLTYWNGNNTNLSAHQTASSKDANSVSMNPNYFSATDLHTKSLAFNNLGTPITGITTDFDGETRDATTPDIGADEFTPPARDISVTSIQPFNTVSGNQNIIINFATYGTDTLTTAQFNYSVNGTPGTTPATWTGNLTNGQSANGINIGSFNFQPGQNVVKAWPVLVNGAADQDNDNDTNTYSFTITTDAGIIAMDEASVQYGTSPISAFVANYGSDVLTSATVNWSVNGVPQTPASWTGSLTNGNADGPVSLGNFTFTAGIYVIKIWTSTPNSLTDDNATNDTLTKTFTFAVDAGISQIDPPGVVGTQNIVVHLKNFGTIPLTSATINYEVNSGTPQTYNWTGNLAVGASDGPITIGTGTFAYGAQSIEAWTSSPNGGTDANTANDGTLENFNITSDIGIVDGNIMPQQNCGRGNDTLKLKIQNFGTGPVSGPFSISYQEGTSTPVTETVPSTVTIAAGDTYWYTFSTLVNLSVTGQDSTFDLTGWVSLTSDANQTNDSITGQVESWYTPTAPIASGTSVAYGNSAALSATLVNGDSLKWYDDGYTPVGTGVSYNTPALYDTTTFYVSAQSVAIGNTQTLETFGSGTSYNSTSTSPSPYSHYYKANKIQYLYTAAELTALGFSAGNITSLAFDVAVTNTVATLDYTLSLANTTATSLTTFDNTALTTVYYNSAYNVYNGWNTHTFQTPFYWDGTSNLLVQICSHNFVNNYTQNASVRYTIATNMARFYRSDTDVNYCSNTGGTASSYRPNIQIIANKVSPLPLCESSMTPVVVNVTGIPSDAGISAIEPVTETGTQNVNLTLKNFTSVMLTSATINYTVNGTPGTPYSWTGSLGNGATANLTVGAGAFVYGANTIKAWSSNPNGSADPNANNDTIVLNFNIVSDIGVTDVLEPLSGCALTSSIVKAEIENFGNDTIDSYSVSYKVIGATSPVSEVINTSLAPGATYVHTFATPVNLTTTTDSIFELKVYTTYSNDANAGNDTVMYEVFSRPTPIAPVTENDTINYGTPATLVAINSGFDQLWYSSSSGGSDIHLGDTLHTVALFDTTTYYVESRTTSIPGTDKSTVSIGTGTVTGQSLPIEPYYGYTYSQTIYTAAEIGSSGFINKLAWNFAGTSLSLSKDWKVYIGHTTKTQFNSTNDWVPLSELTLVFDGTLPTTTGPQWIELITNNFFYNGTDNLVIAVDENTSTYDGTNDDFYCTFVGTNRSIEYHADGTNPDPASPPAGTLRGYIANIKIDVAQPAPACLSARVPVTAIVQNFPALDAGVLSVNSPESGPGKGNAEVLNITVKNYGTVTIDTLPVAYVLDAGTPVIDTVFATLAPGDTANFSFATTMNLSAFALYNVNVYTDLDGDVVTNNDAVSVQILHTDYCLSKANNTSDGDIGNVNIKHPVTNNNLLNNGVALPVMNNPIANKTYSNFTNLTPTIMEIGQQYPVSVSQITGGANFYGSTAKIYIDLNQNGVLDAATELVWTGTTTNSDPSTNLMQGTITIPATAALGNTRMRIVLDEDDVAPPCGNYGWGETEDYTIQIVQQVFANAGPNDTVCNTHATTLTGSGIGDGINYAWSTTDLATSTTVSPTTTTMYYFSVTDTYGFTAVDSAEVYVRDLPTLNFPTLSAMCVDASGLTLDMATPSGGNYYGAGVGTGTFTPSTAGVGTHTLQYIYTDIHGCTDSTTQTITVNALPIISLSTPSAVCYDAALYPLSFATSPSGGTYLGAGVDGSGNFKASIAGAGNHYLKYEYTDANGCYNVDSITQVVHGLPVVNATATPDTIFYGTSTNLSVSASGSIPSTGPSYSYSWTPVDSLSSVTLATSQTPTTKNLSVPTTFTVGVTNQTTGCVNTDNVTVFIKGGPLTLTPTATLDTVCSGSNTQINAQASGGAETYYYSWTSNPAGFTSTDAVISVNPLVTTMYYITVDDGSNTKSDSIEIYVHALPTATAVNATAAICLYDSTQISANLTGASPWTIYVSDGTNPSVITNVTSPWSIYVAPTVSTTYYLDSLVDANGCFNTSTAQTAVTVYDLPTVTATGSDTMCYGDSIQFTLTFTGASPWEFDVSHIGTTMNSNATESNITSPFTVWADDMESTTHYITRLKDANGCQITGSPIDSVYSFVRPLPTAAITSDSVFHCFGDSSLVTINFTAGSLWTVTYSDGTNNYTLPGQNSPNLSYASDTVSTWWTITQITDQYGCTNNAVQDSLFVNVWTLPTPTFTGLNAAYCVDAAAATLVPTPTGGTFTGSGISGSTFTPSSAGTGNKTITYTYTDANGCVNTYMETTDVNPLPTVTLAAFADVCEDASPFTLTGGLPLNGTYSGAAPTIAEIGTGTTTQGYPFYTYYMDSRTQMLYTASELSASGATGGYISSIAFNISSAASQVMNGFTISMKNSTATSISDWDNTGLTTVFQGNYSISGTGWQTINLTTPFLWDGTSNILVNVCFDNSSYTANSYVYTTSAPGMNYHAHFDGSSTSGCSTTNSGVSYSTYRPNVRFTVGPSSPINAGIFNPAIANIGANTVIYTYTDGNSCVNSDTASITVNALPTLTLPTLAPVCIDANPFAITGASPNGGTWTGTGVNTNNFDPATAGANTHNLTYTFTDINGCTNLDSTTITVNALPVLTVSGLNTDYCENGSSSTLVPTPTGGTFAGTGITGNVFDPTVNGAGSVAVVYFYTDANGCFNSITNTVSIHPTHTPQFTGLNSAYCVTDMLSALVPDSTGGVFSGIGINGSNFDPTVAGVGTYDIKYVYTTAHGCVDSVIQSTVVNGLPTVMVSGLAAQYCQNGLATDTVVVSPVGGTITGAVNAANAFDPAMGQLGNNDIIYAYTDMNGCANSDTISTTIVAIPSIALPTAQTSCAHDTVTLDPGQNINFEYLWSTGDTTSTLAIDSSFQGISTANYSVVVTDLTTTCSAFDTSSITFEAYPVINIPDTISICGYTPIDIVAGTNPNFVYLWSTGATTAALTIDSSMTQGGYFGFDVTVTSPAGCSETKAFWVIFHPESSVDLGNDTSICINNTITLDAGAGYNYLWSTNETTQTITIDGSVVGLGLHNISVIVENNGCYNTDDINIMVNPCTGIDDYDGDLNLSIYPNPNNGQFTLEVLNKQASNFNFRITDLAGKTIAEGVINPDGQTIYTHNFDLRTYSKGVYMLTISNDQIIKTERIVIQ